MPCPHAEWIHRSSSLLAALALLVPSLALGQQVFVADAMRKIRASEQTVPTATSASIHAARNEFEAFQLVVRGPATDVTAVASTLTGPGGATITAASCNTPGDVRLYREALYWVDPAKKSDVYSMTGWIPDALVPQVDEFDNQCRSFSFSVPSGENRVIWADVHVPPDAPAGTYTGTVTVSWAGGSTAVPVTLEVWGFALPSRSSLRSYYGYPYNALSVQHGTPYCTSGLALLMRRYATLALDHRMSFTNFDDGCSYTDVTGAYTVNYGSVFDGTVGARLRGAAATGIVYMGDPSSSTDLAAWASQSKSHGWFDRLFEYAADEPPHFAPWTVIGPRARLAHSIDPAFRILVVTSIERARDAAPTSDFSVDDIDVFVANVDQLEPAPSGNTRSAYDSWLAGSAIKEVWQYQSCDTHGCGDEYPVGSDPATGYYPRWPSYTIDASLVRARALEWLSFKNALSGELYFSATEAYLGTNSDPWTDQWRYNGHGDGTLFYPGTPAKIGGTTHVPVASMRMRMIREGMEDYEYLHLLEAQGDRQYALDQLATVFGPASDVDRDPDALYAARGRLACRILANLGAPCGGAPVTQANLTVTKAGAGGGSVASTPAGIDCGTSCSSQSAPFLAGTAVTLTATATAGSTFGGFGGGCTTTATTCTFTLAADASVTATFDAAPLPGGPLFTDGFDRTTGLGSSWSVRSGSFTTDGAYAVSGSPPPNGNGSFARVVPGLGTSDYSVTARILAPAGASRSGVAARSSDRGDKNYAAQISTAGGGSVNLYRRNRSTWTQLGTASAAIAPGTPHDLKLSVTGSNPVHLEVRLDGQLQIRVDDSSAGQHTSGAAGMLSYDASVKYDSFTVELP